MPTGFLSKSFVLCEMAGLILELCKKLPCPYLLIRGANEVELFTPGPVLLLGSYILDALGMALVYTLSLVMKSDPNLLKLD